METLTVIYLGYKIHFRLCTLLNLGCFKIVAFFGYSCISSLCPLSPQGAVATGVLVSLSHLCCPPPCPHRCVVTKCDSHCKSE